MDSKHFVYAKIDKYDRIIDINSSAFVATGWGIAIDEGQGDRYHHAQGNYFPDGLFTEEGIPLYKLQDGQPVERTEEEIAADRAALPAPEPTTAELLDILLGTG